MKVRSQYLWIFITLVELLGLTLTSCATSPEPATLRLAVLPILDALPMYVAQEQGYFDESNCIRKIRTS